MITDINNSDTLLQALEQTYRRARFLVTSLTASQLKIPYHSGVNPPLWELGHCAFFYEYFILMALDKVKSFDPFMDDIWDSFQLDHKDRWLDSIFPNRQQTLHYSDLTLEKIRQRILSREMSDRQLYLYKYAIFHQNMHIESKIWCRQTVGYARSEWPETIGLKAPAKAHAESNLPAEDARVPSGTWVIGMPTAADSARYAAGDFAFDNEKPRFEVSLGEFAIAKTLVTNKEFLAFVEDGGYQRQELWSQGGKRWLKIATEQPRNPVYWKLSNHGWLERCFDQWLPLQDDFPVVHISYWEAEAWCRWAGRRLPTEFEWEAAALGNRPDKAFRKFPWGDSMQADCADLDGILLARLPVNALAKGDSPFGCRQMVGTVWEWTSDQFFPYDGFVKDMYPFMSTLQFGDHKTTRGGSCATSSILIRGTYRQAYLPDRTDVYTGFRSCAL